MSVQSAGTTSPRYNRTMSPGTSVRASTSCHVPLRSARAFSANELFNASSAFEASCSSQNPSTALNNSSDVMIAKSPQSPTTNAINAAASIIHGMGAPEVAGQSGRRTLLFFREGVWPVRLQSRLNLALGQTRLRIGSPLRWCLDDGWASGPGDIWRLHYSLLLSQ